MIYRQQTRPLHITPPTMIHPPSRLADVECFLKRSLLPKAVTEGQLNLKDPWKAALVSCPSFSSV